MAPHAWYARALAACGFFAAVVPCAVMWGFTVDDALIPLRYAHHVATGAGYRFNVLSPRAATDGVTPLPWVPLLVLLARGDIASALTMVKMLGAIVWTVGATILGRALAARADDRTARSHAVAALALVGLAFPIGAWAASGMETGVATALATVAAASIDKPRRAAAFAGLAASLRPELVVWAIVLSFGAAAAKRAAPRATMGVAALAALPFIACCAVRLAAFGHVAPLALSAKPSDASHGLSYAFAATVVVLTPLLLLAPRAIASANAEARAIAAAAVAHVLVVVAVGGDWMPYARLMVPIAPSLALVHVTIARGPWAWARVLGAAVLGFALATSAAPAGRHVLEDRARLIEAARPVLATSRVVAALDVGWVGAATEADIVDLAGLTDPAIASLPGGHTSKRVDVGMLLDRGVDTVVIYVPERAVESRLVGAALFAERFELARELPLGTRPGAYQIYRRKL